MSGNLIDASVPDGRDKLTEIVCSREQVQFDRIAAELEADQVVLVKNVDPDEANRIVENVADRFGLSDNLKLQAALAGSLGHRHNIGRFFMSVNKRAEFEFIPPHSEGNSFIGMQLAAFYCYENSTDGGETILLNVDNDGQCWNSLRERVNRARLGSRPLTKAELAMARLQYKVEIPKDLLQPDDQILDQSPTKIPGLTVFDALARPRKIQSRILNKLLFAYWDSIASSDFDSGLAFTAFLRSRGILKEPGNGRDDVQLDNAANRRVWRSGINFKDLFKYSIVLRLDPGTLVIQNNMTWAHAANNWTPGSGVRKIAASFA